MATHTINVTGTIDPNAKSEGGNGADDAGKLLVFGADGGISATSDGNTAAEFVSDTGRAVSAVNSSLSEPALYVQNNEDDNTLAVAKFLNWEGQGLEVLTKTGALQWTSLTGAADTRTNLGLGALAVQGDGDKGDITVSASGDTWTIDDNAVTYAKMQDIPSNHLIGRHTGGAGDPQNINIDGGLELQGASIRRSALTGDVTASAGGDTTTIANDVVTNAKLANMATTTIKGRVSAGTGDPEDLTASQARTVLGLGTAALVNTGTGSGDVPTITDADARYLTPYNYSLLPTWTVGTQATTSTTLADVTDTELTVPGVGMYEFEYSVTYNANATTTGAGFGVRNTVGGTADYNVIEVGVDAGIGDRSTFRGGFGSNLISQSSFVTTGNRAIVRGRAIFNAATAIRLQFRTEIATTTTITVTNVEGFIRRVA